MRAFRTGRYFRHGKMFTSKHEILSKEWKADYTKWVKHNWPRANQEWTPKEDKDLIKIVDKHSSQGKLRRCDMQTAFRMAEKKLGRTISACEGRYRILKLCECRHKK